MKFLCLWSLKGTSCFWNRQNFCNALNSKDYCTCDAEIHRTNCKRHKFNPVTLKSPALFSVPFIFLNLEYASDTLKNVLLNCKEQMKSTLMKISDITSTYSDEKNTFKCVSYTEIAVLREEFIFNVSVSQMRNHTWALIIKYNSCKYFGSLTGTISLINFKGKKRNMKRTFYMKDTVFIYVKESFLMATTYCRWQNYSSTCDNTCDFSLDWLSIFIISYLF